MSYSFNIHHTVYLKTNKATEKLKQDETSMTLVHTHLRAEMKPESCIYTSVLELLTSCFWNSAKGVGFTPA